MNAKTIAQFAAIAIATLGADAVKTYDDGGLDVSIHEDVFYIEESGGLIVWADCSHTTPLGNDPELAFNALQSLPQWHRPQSWQR